MSGYIGQNLPYGTFNKQSFSIRYKTDGSGQYERSYGPLVQRVSNESSILVMCDRLLLEPVTDYTIVNNAVSGNLTQSIRFNDLLDFASLDSGAAGIKIQILYLGKELLTSSVSSIGNVQDVQLNNPQDGQLITYDATQQKWINANSNFVSEALAAAVEARIDNMENYVNGKISDLVAGAPATLDTLNELAEALGEDENFATTISTNIGVIQNNLDQEIAVRFLAVSSEESARAAADAAIEVNLDNEIARAEAAEAALDLRVTDIEASNLPEILTRLDVAESNTDQNTFDISELNTSLASYLKIDGTTTMTGSLNLDNNSILIGQTDTSQSGEGIKITPTEFRLHYKNEINLGLPAFIQRRREVYLDPEYIRLNLYDGDENVLSEISFSHSQGPTWTGTPTQPNHFTTKQYVDGQVGTKVSTSSLSPVALSGSYNDLTDKPNLSSLDELSDVSINNPQSTNILAYTITDQGGFWTNKTAEALVSNVVSAVALSGSYNDLTDKPAGSSFSGSYNELTDKPVGSLVTSDYQEFPGGSKVFDYIMAPEVSSKYNGDLVLSSYYPGAQGSKIKLSNTEFSSQIDFYTKSTLYGEDLAMSVLSGGRVSANLGAIISQPDKTQAVLKLTSSENLGQNETQNVITVNDGSSITTFSVNSAGSIQSAQMTFLLNKIAELEARIEALENPVGV